MAEDSPDGLAEVLRDAFGWAGEIIVAPGPRGATARIWQVTVGTERYALKEGLREPPSVEAVEAELGFVRHAAAVGVRVPALHADRAGRRLVPGPDGSWLRLYDWVDTRPADLGSPATPIALGELMARLHRAAPAMSVEPDGSPADPWYERAPAVGDFDDAVASGAPWATRLADRIASMPDLCAIVIPAERARLVVCHRDLHPGNVVVDQDGALVVLDADDVGPADPARELARALFDWASDPEPDLDAMRTTCRAYVEAGGPARVRALADFSMLIASRLNFLRGQLRLALDPSADGNDRAWAEQEIDESLRIMPTLGQLHGVIAALRLAT